MSATRSYDRWDVTALLVETSLPGNRFPYRLPMNVLDNAYEYVGCCAESAWAR